MTFSSIFCPFLLPYVGSRFRIGIITAFYDSIVEYGNTSAYDARLVDIWACGIVYYCLHFQELPWRVAQPSDSLYASYATACNSSSPQQAACPPTINNLSPRACRPLLRKMLEPDPKQRWLIDEVIQHAWVKGIEVCIDMQKPTHVHQHAKTTVHSLTQAS